MIGNVILSGMLASVEDGLELIWDSFEFINEFVDDVK